MEKAELENLIINGDARHVLRQFPDAAFDCVISSPPYFAQRDYGAAGQIGCEASAAAYVASLAEVFRECNRVLKPEGSLWLNLGDKYQEGRLLGLPWRVALALGDQGWVLRNDIIWHKPNAMPHSVKNRLTVDHEYLFFFTKSRTSYHYDQDAIREEHVTFSDRSQMRGGRNHFGRNGGTPEKGKNGGSANLHDGRWAQAFHPKGRNKRSVWSVPLSKFREAHFAVFPERLIEPCLLAGCPEGGLVLDPFFGAGTTAVVALNHGRCFTGIEINPDYVALAEKRIARLMPGAQAKAD
ncbi:DNA-methyltransferase [Geomesophilobacter sediminis]|uniref:Methyltransferase n=1 Tax=Geomesophilobacter sediminis TaxID=2798584 RepID=A0A8J7SBZ9_9BACT|nr:site-specific DNA-methyltransferase [Geomesophilobacter sediminis]MBJ6726719.1 site-specific DNA-methyltransferase [Geomesophilobacter sediminis]